MLRYLSYTEKEFLDYNLQNKSIELNLIQSSKKYKVYYSSFLKTIFLVHNLEYFKGLSNTSSEKVIINSIKSRMDNDELFSPRIILIMTSGCNLRCSYCFADGGKEAKFISLENAKALIRFVKKRFDKIEISFFGGEPTLAFSRIIEIVDYVKSQFTHNNYTFFMSTNGIISKKIMNYLLENKFTLKISYDGPPSINNKQRSSASGSNISKLLEVNLALIPQANRLLEVTITQGNVEKLEQVISYFNNLGANKIYFEIVNEFGRAKSQNSIYNQVPEFELLRKKLLETIELANEYKIEIKSGLFPIDRIGNDFCGFTKPIICLTTDGYLSGCPIIQSSTASFDEFIYGKLIDEDIIFDYEKIKKIKKRKVENLSGCEDCLIKYNCAGGCAFYTYLKEKDFMKQNIGICNLKKRLNKQYLEYAAEREFIKLKPHLLVKNNIRSYELFFNSFITGKNLFEYNLGGNLEEIKLEILKRVSSKKHIPYLFLFNFSDYANNDFVINEKTIDFFRQLNEKQIYYKMIRPIRKCNICLNYANPDLLNKLIDYLPKDCFECLDLFKVDGQQNITFCNGNIGKKKLNDYCNREEIFREFTKIRKLNSKCARCVSYLRGKCEGEYNNPN